MFWKQQIIIVIQKHHFFLLAPIIVLIFIIILICILAFFLEFFQFIRVCSSDKLTIHIKNLALWVHQKFSFISFNLNPSHYHVVFHIDAHLFSFLCCRLLSVIFIILLRNSQIILCILSVLCVLIILILAVWILIIICFILILL